MTRENIDLITRLSTSDLSTDDFIYLKSFIDGARTCINCKWNRDGVCVNDKSPLCADFVSDDYGCVLWENNND